MNMLVAEHGLRGGSFGHFASVTEGLTLWAQRLFGAKGSVQ